MLLGKIGRNEEKFFLDPAKAISVICHEIGHLVEGKLNPNMLHSGQSGAVGEAYGDLFSLFVTNEIFHGGAAMPGPGSADHRDRWGMGHDFLVPVSGENLVQYLRHFHDRAHKDGHPALGNCIDDHHWPTKTDGGLSVEYKKTRVVDDGGEHLDASALNFMHYKMTMAFGGDIKKTINIFSMGIALSNVARNRVVVNDEIAAYEVMAARSLYGDEAATIVHDLWVKELGYKISELEDLKLPEVKQSRVIFKSRGVAKNGGVAALWQGLRTYAGLR
jgi:Zn-dependent metalloprotease